MVNSRTKLTSCPDSFSKETLAIIVPSSAVGATAVSMESTFPVSPGFRVPKKVSPPSMESPSYFT